jgi:hypothetical protein
MNPAPSLIVISHCKKISATRTDAALACAESLEPRGRPSNRLKTYANVQILCAMKLHSMTTPVMMICEGR